MSVLMIFVDRIGIGTNDADVNPFARFQTPFFLCLAGQNTVSIPYDGTFTSTDASLSVKGLPQSATGQTALLTGINAAKILGRHLSGFPSKTLREILLQESIFLKLQKIGKVGTFANAFTPEYFQRHRRKISATTGREQFSTKIHQSQILHL